MYTQFDFFILFPLKYYNLLDISAAQCLLVVASWMFGQRKWSHAVSVGLCLISGSLCDI
jgi:hypothetical protein